MSICPHCGAKVELTSKNWQSISKNKDDSDEPNISMATFQCSACKANFSVQVLAHANSSRTVNVKNKVERIMRIQGALMQTIKTLKDKIAALETEKSSLMAEIETLRKTAEARVVTLEAEVDAMRKEAKSLRELVGKSEPAVLIPPQNPTAPN